jgi:hypothetical protein
MRRSPLGNAFAAVMLLWFALVTAEPAVLHSCPVHSGHVQGSTVNRGEHDAASGAGDHSHHAASGSPAAQEAQSHDGDAPAAHRCACIGDCSTGTSIAGLPSARVAIATSVEWQVRGTVVRDASPIVTAPEFLRPYANGPPSGRRIA